ncbi:nucleotidyltransferase domain-containing protein [Candidatus Woesearchaeota archaeon]|nr:nucleotidyltransferase domain-containing protein [Candidatus Woesearchaeota archaeon]
MDRTIQKSGFIRKELLLLQPFAKEPWREFTLTEVKQLTKTKSHHFAFDALKKFTAMQILEEKKKGNLNLYRVTIESETSIGFLALVEAHAKQERQDIPLKNITKITEKLKNSFYALLIAGSYAEKKQKPASDLDIAIIIPDSEIKKPYEIALKEGELMIPEAHGFVFMQEEFLKMLLNKEFNYGKELARKHIIYTGAEPYYRMLFEAIRHGFKG